MFMCLYKYNAFVFCEHSKPEKTTGKTSPEKLLIKSYNKQNRTFTFGR